MVAPKLVSYQGNYGVPGFRWMRYKEGFSQDLVQLLIQRVRPSSLLDPFSGIGTAPLVASGHGIKATGIELIPVGLLVGQAISRAANGLDSKLFAEAAAGLLDHISSNSQIAAGHAFPHIDITGQAFPSETESELARARAFISEMKDRDTIIMLNLACMSVLESVSFTQKDGQFLRWDRRSGKSRSATFQKKSILRLKDALECRLGAMLQDLGYVQERYGKGVPDFIAGSSLDYLKRFPIRQRLDTTVWSFIIGQMHLPSVGSRLNRRLRLTTLGLTPLS